MSGGIGKRHDGTFKTNASKYHLIVRKWNSSDSKTGDVWESETLSRAFLPTTTAAQLVPDEEKQEVLREAYDKFDTEELTLGSVVACVHTVEKPSYGTNEFGIQRRTIAGIDWFDEPVPYKEVKNSE